MTCFWSIKASVSRGKIQIVPSAMAGDIFYHFSDEENEEDALLDRAFYRWEHIGGGSTIHHATHWPPTQLARCPGAGAIQYTIASIEGSRGWG